MCRFVFIFLACSLATLSAAGHHPDDWTPRELEGAVLFPRLAYLPPTRVWERVDVWVPAAGEEPKPCVILFYGGGYGGKVTGGLHETIQVLINNGYVVAMPDYALANQQPEPMVFHDGVRAVQYLRQNAERFQIDPTRIGAWGFSAGGWLLQGMAPAESQTIWPLYRPNGPRNDYYGSAPSLPAFRGETVSAGLQAWVSDWGASNKTENRYSRSVRSGFWTADDPPMFTCHNAPDGSLSAGVEAYRRGGAIAEQITLDINNTHVPPGDTIGVTGAGVEMTWLGSVIDFLDRHVKNPTVASAPRVYPSGGGLLPGESVSIISVYGDAAIRYTIDGTDPTERSDVYSGPVVLGPNQELRVANFTEDLSPSPVVVCRYVEAGRAAPVIDRSELSGSATVGSEFTHRFTIADDGPARWLICGDTHLSDSAFWEIDRDTGLLAGVPVEAGVYPLLVVVEVGEGEAVRRDVVEFVVLVE